MKYVVVDLEMCNVTRTNRCSKFPWSSETIQIGAVLLDEQYEIIDSFNSYVSPEHGTLDAFISSLTGITNKDIKDAPQMTEAVELFLKWIPEDAVMVSWSTTDLAQLKNEAKSKAIHNEKLESFYSTWLDCQRLFDERSGANRQVSLAEALMAAEITIEGREHNGLDDAINTAKLFAKLQTEPELKLMEVYSKAKVEQVEHLSYSLESIFAGLQIQYA